MMLAPTRRPVSHVENGTPDHAGDVFREPVANPTDTVEWQHEQKVLFRNSVLLPGLLGDPPEYCSDRHW